MPADQSEDTPEITPQDTTVGAPESGVSTTPPPFPALTAERMFDIALGAIAIAAEATNKRVQELGDQARTLREDAPEILETWEERGRPLREQLLGKIREGLAPIADDAPTTAPAEETPSAPALPSTSSAPSPAPAPTPVQTPAQTRVREISALEQRVRELEAQVAAPVIPETVPETTPESEVALESAMTPAEVATFDPEAGDEPIATLSDSPYAVSETDTEVEREAFEKSPFDSDKEE